MDYGEKSDYDIISESGLFDEVWFKNKYKLSEDIDLISYYLDNAIKLGLNPSPMFNTLEYLKKYSDVANSNINPFVHYIMYGISEKRISHGTDLDIVNDKYSLINYDYTPCFFKRYDNLLKEYNDANFGNQINIGIFLKGGYNSFFPTGYIRMIVPFYHLFLEKNINPYLFPTNDLDKIEKEFLFSKVKLFDIIIVQRDSLDMNTAKSLISYCRRFDIKLIYEIDDDLLGIDESHPNYEEFIPKKEVIKYLISNANAVTVSSNNLKDKIHNLNSNIKIIKNCLNDLFNIEKRVNYNNSSVIKIGYMGTITHENDFNLIEEAIIKVKRYFADKNKKIIFEIIGVTNKESDYVNSIEIPKGNDKYPNFIKWISHTIDWDIGLAPLEHNEINNSKSEIKYIEYASIGVPGIYSNVGAYSEVIKDKNGILVKNNSVTEWANAIIKLIENKSLREEIIRNSKEDILENYSTNVLVESWSDVINDLLSEHEQDIFNKSNPFKLFSNPHFKREYDIILNSNLFDKEYYLKNYEDILGEYADPIYHYLVAGCFEKCNPSDEININSYIKYEKINIEEINPFIHYISNNNFDFNFNTLNSVVIDDICTNLQKKVSIIIPIYNAYEDTKKCIESVLKYSTRDYELILINDCSSDKRIDDLLKKYADYHQIKVINNLKNKGFTGTVNVGLRNSEHDVILLNSDTIVTPKWLEKLTIAAFSDSKIGTVTPFSNNAGAFSVPVIGKRNVIKEDFPLNIMSNLVEKVSDYEYMRVPTGNGFCLYIKRDTINSVGCFDEETFGRGYGEENDYCMRAIQNNWENIIDDSTYIYHNQGSSFSTERNQLMIKHRRLLDKKHPTYTREVRKFLSSNIFENMHNKITEALIRIDSKKYNKKRILFTIHSRSGGSPKNCNDIISFVEKDYDCYLLFAHTQVIILYHYYNGEFIQIKEWKLSSRWWSEKLYDDEYRDIYFNVLYNLKIDLIHIHHFMHHTFDLPKIAKLLNIPIVFSLHDCYMICPCFTLLDENYNYCEGRCSDNLVNCQIPSMGITQKTVLKSFIDEWRFNVSQIFKYIDYIVSFSDYIKKLFIDIFPDLTDKNFLIIEHGENYPSFNKKLFEIPSPNKPIKILCMGNILRHKGSKIIEDIHNLDTDSNIEFHFLGTIDDNLKDVGIYHGIYEQDNLPNLINKIKPSFSGIFSIWPETFCYTLSESWAYKLPVLATKMGVIEERMIKNEGGVFIDANNPSNSYKIIMDIKNNLEKYTELQKNIEKIKFKSKEEMCSDYLEIYNKLCDFDDEVKL